jgi:hypothetical protein
MVQYSVGYAEVETVASGPELFAKVWEGHAEVKTVASGPELFAKVWEVHAECYAFVEMIAKGPVLCMFAHFL